MTLKQQTWPLAVVVLGLASCGPAASPPGSAVPSALPSVVPTAGPSATPTATPVPTPRLQGFVLDESLGPLAEVEVQASGVPGVSTRTGPQGQYELALPAGVHWIVAGKPGFTTRSRQVKVGSDDLTLNFGGIEADGLTNPYFLSRALEVTQVQVQEEKPGGPLRLSLDFSEPVASGAAQQAAVDRVELRTGAGAPFLRTVAGGLGNLQMKAAFQDGGKRLVLDYPGPYLPSGPQSGKVRLALQFRQDATDKKDAVTRETIYEDMGIVDAEGQALGRGRSAYAFLMASLSFLNGVVMVDKTYGYGPADRRWNLTHQAEWSFTAAEDAEGPGLLEVKVEPEVQLGTVGRDLMKLTFSEPLRVAKDRDTPYFVPFDETKDLVVVNVSKESTGPLQPLGAAKPVEVEFLDAEPKVMYLRYAFGVFKDFKRVEVILGRDLRDPAGNPPDPKRSQVEGVVS